MLSSVSLPALTHHLAKAPTWTAVVFPPPRPNRRLKPKLDLTAETQRKYLSGTPEVWNLHPCLLPTWSTPRTVPPETLRGSVKGGGFPGGDSAGNALHLVCQGPKSVHFCFLSRLQGPMALVGHLGSGPGPQL